MIELCDNRRFFQKLAVFFRISLADSCVAKLADLRSDFSLVIRFLQPHSLDSRKKERALLLRHFYFRDFPEIPLAEFFPIVFFARSRKVEELRSVFISFVANQDFNRRKKIKWTNIPSLTKAWIILVAFGVYWLNLSEMIRQRISRSPKIEVNTAIIIFADWLNPCSSSE